VTHLRKMMLEELERHNYSIRTIRYYLRFVERFAQHFGKSPDKLGPEISIIPTSITATATPAASFSPANRKRLAPSSEVHFFVATVRAHKRCMEQERGSAGTSLLTKESSECYHGGRAQTIVHRDPLRKPVTQRAWAGTCPCSTTSTTNWRQTFWPAT
jgi:hypothetical protein